MQQGVEEVSDVAHIPHDKCENSCIRLIGCLCEGKSCVICERDGY